MDDFRCFHERYYDFFQCWFGNEADDYWNIFTAHQEGISYDKLSMKYYYSPTKLRSIVKSVESFLKNPNYYLNEEIYEKFLCNKFYYPELLLECNGRKCSHMAYEILKLAIGLNQKGRPTIIPRDICNRLQPQYKNRERRAKLLEELTNMMASVGGWGTIKVFSDVYEEKGRLKLSFAKDVYEKIMTAMSLIFPEGCNFTVEYMVLRGEVQQRIHMPMGRCVRKKQIDNIIIYTAE